MRQIYSELYQFTMHIPAMHFTLHQYLLAAKEPILISTGTVAQAKKILPEVKEILAGKKLKYILVPHIEADECGGLSIFKDEYPDVITVCSELGARELNGFGYSGKVVIGKMEEVLSGNDFSMKFIPYPSEVHLQDGIVIYEEMRKIFFSSDLMLRYGDAFGETIDSNWRSEVEAISEERIPNKVKLDVLKKNLLEIKPEFIAVGHGYCVNCRV